MGLAQNKRKNATKTNRPNVARVFHCAHSIKNQTEMTPFPHVCLASFNLWLGEKTRLPMQDDIPIFFLPQVQDTHTVVTQARQQTRRVPPRYHKTQGMHTKTRVTTFCARKGWGHFHRSTSSVAT